ncbi:MAG TPA: cell wall anchor protein, partial [Chitinophagaceae bacterium]|nr:cell wall anchor protein [Chitinophagaceae bacterium]
LSVPNVTLQAGKIYTLFARGLLSGSGSQALNASIITHN